MARLWYGGAPADFAVDLGADADIVDSGGTPTGDQGSALLVPLVARTFDVFIDEALSTQTTDLLDDTGSAITQVQSETTFDRRGTLPRFQGPDGHEGALWLRVSGGTGDGYRLDPDSDTLFSRVGDLETIGTTDLDDVATAAPTNGQVLAFSSTSGEYEPATIDGSNAVEPGDQVDLTAGTDRLLLVRIHDDGTASGSWVDRLAFEFETGGQGSGTFDRTTWFNEFGEFRTMASANSRVPLRVHGNGAGQTADMFQVRQIHGDPDSDVLRVAPLAVTARQPLIVDAPYMVINGTRLYVQDTSPGLAPEGSAWINTGEEGS